MKQETLARILNTPGVVVSGGAIELAPGQDPATAVKADLAPLRPGYRRAAVQAFVQLDGRIAGWKTFDLPWRITRAGARA